LPYMIDQRKKNKGRKGKRKWFCLWRALLCTKN
jgi:hypothetical protein